MIITFFFYPFNSIWQDCKHEHVGGDMNDKITEAARDLMDAAYSQTIADLEFVIRTLERVCRYESESEAVAEDEKKTYNMVI